MNDKKAMDSVERRQAAFTLVEMIVVIGIIGVLISVLMPALSKARQQANKVVCMAHLSDMGKILLMYANDNHGYMFPDLGWPAAQKAVPDAGSIGGFDPGPYLVTDPLPHLPGGKIYYTPLGPNDQLDVWPYYVFNHVWNPPFMVCPSDIDPQGQHSYLANKYLLTHTIASSNGSTATTQQALRWGQDAPSGHSYSDIIVMGEKNSSVFDYFMDPNDFFDGKVNQFRHGLTVGSNYLMMDFHVETMVPASASQSLDPWDFYPPSSQP